MIGVDTCSLDKWLGKGTVACLAVDGKGTKAALIESVRRWVAARGRNVTLPGERNRFSPFAAVKPALVMIVSYETLRTLAAELNNCEVGLLVCDEGHRLKNSGLSLSEALPALLLTI